MAGFRTVVEVTGLDDARRVARQVRNLGEDIRPLLEIAGAIAEASTKRRFDEGHGPDGVPWPPSKAALGQARRASGAVSPGKTLVDTGDLEGSVRYVVHANDVEIGVDGRGGGGSPHAAALQFGSRRQAVVVGHTRVINSAFGVPLASPRTVNVRPHGRVTNLPPRPFIGIDEQDRRDIHDGWLDHLRGLFHA